MALETRAYTITGSVADNGWIYANRELLDEHIREDMRFNDILPILDMPTDLSCSYNEESSMFEFVVTASGYPMENAVEFMGILLKDGVIVNKDATRAFLCDAL